MKNTNCIDEFQGDYEFLSNFYECPVSYNRMTFKNSEAAFQSMKCCTRNEALPFQEYTASKSKRCGRHVTLRPDWEEIKLRVMEEIVHAKFAQNIHLAKKLIATGNAELIEGNSWGDTYWGVDIKTNTGENHLGIILMKIRSELIAVNLPQFVIRSKDFTGLKRFRGAISDKEKAFAIFEKMQSDNPQYEYELTLEYPYGDSVIWNPQTSLWMPTEMAVKA